jgi:hypothetical protein
MRRVLILVLAASVAIGCSVFPGIWIPRSPNADALFRFIKDGKAGYIDAGGHIVIPASLNPKEANEFVDGVSVSERRFRSRDGSIAFGSSFEHVTRFSEDMAAAMPKGGSLWGYIDKSGNFAIPPRFASGPEGWVSEFSEGLARVQVGEHFGFINRSGDFAIPHTFLDASDFSGGFARVIAEGPCVTAGEGPCIEMRTLGLAGQTSPEQRFGLPLCGVGFIDKSGRMIFPHRFERAHNFSQGLAAVRVGRLWGFIDERGDFAIQPQFDDALSFSSGLAVVRLHGKYGFVNKSGQLQIPPSHHMTRGFAEGLAVVTSENFDRSWYIDTQGNRAFPGDFADASSFFKGLAHVRYLREKNDPVVYAYIDKTGREVFRYHPEESNPPIP